MEQTQANSEILTPDEQAEAIRKAVLKKEADIRQKNYWSHLKKPDEKKNWRTSVEIIEDIEDNCHEDKIPFVIDDENRKVIELLSQYFAGDPEFEKDGRSLDKGIFLFGGVGIGKTHLMKLFRSQQRKPFRIVDCSDIAAEYKKDGEDGIVKYFNDIVVHERNYWNHERIGWCFDDMGIENNTKFFGNESNVMERIIERRYRSDIPLTTHIISNLSTADVEQRYGIRIRERLREMMNLIVFDAKQSRRK